MDYGTNRLDVEWTAANAVRELINLATRGDSSKATYDKALRLGGEIIPDLLGENTSLIRRARESPAVKEFRQRAFAESLEGEDVTTIQLLDREITQLKKLLSLSKKKGENDQLRRALKRVEKAKIEIDPAKHTENQIIFRDSAIGFEGLPELGSGQDYNDYRISDKAILRARVFHPNSAEEITGADILYERHDFSSSTVTIAAVQYKIWEDKSLYLSDPRMLGQIKKMSCFLCDKGYCKPGTEDQTYRFPHCSAFLRPTDRLQSPDQQLISSGEHIPICRIPSVTIKGPRGGDLLTMDSVKPVSLSHFSFQELFSSNKIGSRTLSHEELDQLYKSIEGIADKGSILIHARDCES